MAEKIPVEERPVKLVTIENESIFVDRSVLMQLGTMRTMLEMCSGDNNESFFGPVPVQVSSAVMKMIIKWCQNRAKDNDSTSTVSNGRRTPLGYVPSPKPVNPESSVFEDFTPYDKMFFKYMDHVMLYEIIIAANYLNIPVLLDLACKYVASLIMGKETDEIRKCFNVESDFHLDPK